ncbi:helix-turn-helix domain-containing protein [Lacticaseibacillus jixiensis]|uniref:helix-turn-helix domain-containing protein n=1 Tax=Lacticaseibacillus jixiensis TaxID=3231926 RepID=UPI0036F20BAC
MDIDYATVFLEKSDLMKYRLYELLARPYVQDVTITDLAGMWPHKYQPTYNVFQEILADIVDLTGQSRKTVRTALLEARQLPASLDQYRIYLVKQSMTFHFVDYVLRAPAPSFMQFCEIDYVSRSTVSRKLHTFNQLMKAYGLKVQLTKMRFTGPETVLRYTLYSIYWWIFRGCQWPFDPITPADLHAECDQIGIFNDRPITQTQMQYFLAISHLRIGKGGHIASSAWLRDFDTRVTQLGLRKGQPKAPFTRLDMSFYNYYQISQPRFDAISRPLAELPIEMAVLSDELTMTVVDTVSAVLYQASFGDIDADLHLNLLRLSAGYVVCHGDFPQAEDFISGGDQPVDEAGQQAVVEALLALPDTPAYAVFKVHAARYAQEAVRLAQDYQQATKRVKVVLAIDPATEGYKQLDDFINAVPWVAQVVPNGSDLTIDTGVDMDQIDCFNWYPDALEIASYRERLIAKLVDRRQEKLHA